MRELGHSQHQFSGPGVLTHYFKLFVAAFIFSTFSLSYIAFLLYLLFLTNRSILFDHLYFCSGPRLFIYQLVISVDDILVPEG